MSKKGLVLVYLVMTVASVGAQQQRHGLGITNSWLVQSRDGYTQNINMASLGYRGDFMLHEYVRLVVRPSIGTFSGVDYEYSNTTVELDPDLAVSLSLAPSVVVDVGVGRFSFQGGVGFDLRSTVYVNREDVMVGELFGEAAYTYRDITLTPILSVAGMYSLEAPIFIGAEAAFGSILFAFYDETTSFDGEQTSDSDTTTFAGYILYLPTIFIGAYF